MEEIIKMQEAWNKQEAKLEKSWKLNLEILKKIKIKEAKTKMLPLIWISALTLLFYQLVMWYGVFFSANHLDTPAYVISGIILALWSGMISFGAIRQLKLILSVDYSGPVTDVQKQLLRVKMAIIHYLRLALMILPFYIAFPVVFFEKMFGINFIENTDTTWLIAQSVILMLPTIWIFKNVSPKNANAKWLNWLLIGHGSQIHEAHRFLDEIVAFEKN